MSRSEQAEALRRTVEGALAGPRTVCGGRHHDLETTGDFMWSESERPDRAAAEPLTVIAA